MLGEPVTVCKFGIPLLQMACVSQQDPAQIRGRLGAQNRSRETLLNQQWQIAGVIKMRVSKDHGFDAAGIDGKPCPVPQAQLLQALEQATIDKNPMPVAFNEEFRSGDGAGAA